MENSHEELGTKLTTTPLCLEDRLIAGPKEALIPNRLHQASAFHHCAGIVMQPREHECAALLMQAFLQTVDGLHSGCIEERYATHREDQGMGLSEVCERLIELTNRCKEQWTCKKRNAHMLAFPCGFDPLLLEPVDIHLLDIHIDAGDLVHENCARQEGTQQNRLREIKDDRGKQDRKS